MSDIQFTTPSEYEDMKRSAARIRSDWDIQSLQPGSLYLDGNDLLRFDGAVSTKIVPTAAYDGVMPTNWGNPMGAPSAATSGAMAMMEEEEGEEEGDEPESEGEEEEDPAQPMGASGPAPATMYDGSSDGEDDDDVDSDEEDAGEEDDGEDDADADDYEDHDVLNCGDYADGKSSGSESCDL
jgi:hypothetical protein